MIHQVAATGLLFAVTMVMDVALTWSSLWYFSGIALPI
jgi:hypothetical protein